MTKGEHGTRAVPPPRAQKKSDTFVFGRIRGEAKQRRARSARAVCVCTRLAAVQVIGPAAVYTANDAYCCPLIYVMTSTVILKLLKMAACKSVGAAIFAFKWALKTGVRRAGARESPEDVPRHRRNAHYARNVRVHTASE